MPKSVILTPLPAVSEVPKAPAKQETRSPMATATTAGADVLDASRSTAPGPIWQRFTALSLDIGDRAQGLPPVKVAIVLDEMGLSQFRSDRAITLPGPITLAILPYCNNLAGLVAKARKADHEFLVHLPMEPGAADADPGPNALLTGLPIPKLDRRIAADLARLGGYVGINNHKGSLFTASAQEMRRVMAVLRSQQLLFLDSLTTGRSIGHRLALEHGILTVARDLFLDNDHNPEKTQRQVELTVATKRRHGQVIDIGYPYPETLSTLEGWLSNLRACGLALVPISAGATGLRVIA